MKANFRQGEVKMYKRIAMSAAFCVVACLIVVQLVSAQCIPAGSGLTVYGVTNLGGPQNLPSFIPNNFSCVNDILASPGGGFALTFPVVANNISQFGPLPVGPGFFSAQVGGGNGNGPFGAAATLVTNSFAEFNIANAAPAIPSASYMITSWQSNFITPGVPLAGNLFGTYLSVGGVLPAAGSADAVAMQSEVSVNGGGFVALPSLILAAARNGNFVAFGGVGGAIAFGGGNATFTGLAIDNLAALGVIPPGSLLTFDTTLTALADPASIDSIAPDPNLVAELGGLPQYSLIDTGQPLPEPSTLAMLIPGLLGAGYRLRRKLFQ